MNRNHKITVNVDKMFKTIREWGNPKPPTIDLHVPGNYIRARANTLCDLFGKGMLTINEIRHYNKLDPIPNGDVRYVPSDSGESFIVDLSVLEEELKENNRKLLD